MSAGSLKTERKTNMSKKIKFIAVVLLLGVLIYYYHSEIQEFINSLPLNIPFLAEENENNKNRGSFEYYFKNNNKEEISEESVWNIYEK